MSEPKNTKEETKVSINLKRVETSPQPVLELDFEDEVIQTPAGLLVPEDWLTIRDSEDDTIYGYIDEDIVDMEDLGVIPLPGSEYWLEVIDFDDTTGVVEVNRWAYAELPHLRPEVSVCMDCGVLVSDNAVQVLKLVADKHLVYCEDCMSSLPKHEFIADQIAEKGVSKNGA